jgi:Flavodoxin-like fold
MQFIHWNQGRPTANYPAAIYREWRQSVKTLILLFHSDFAKSKANRALADAASRVNGVEIVQMGQLYPSHDVDITTEVTRLLTANQLVLQFPIQWYSTPPLLKLWQDTVLTRMFYLTPKEEGARLSGLPVMVAATAGNRARKPNLRCIWGVQSAGNSASRTCSMVNGRSTGRSSRPVSSSASCLAFG